MVSHEDFEVETPSNAVSTMAFSRARVGFVLARTLRPWTMQTR